MLGRLATFTSGDNFFTTTAAATNKRSTVCYSTARRAVGWYDSEASAFPRQYNVEAVIQGDSLWSPIGLYFV